MDILSNFHERLKELMTDEGINSPKLAEALSIDSSSITEYLRGRRLPTFKALVAIADYFDCSTDFLLGLSEYPKREGVVFNQTPPFGVGFRLAMEKCNVSQYGLQKKTGITWSNFHKWLNGIRLPYADSLVKLANGLECSVDFLIGREN